MPPSTWLLQNTNEGRGYDPSFVVCMRIPGKALGHGQHPTAFHIIHKAADAHMLWNERRSCEDGYVQRHHCCRPCLMNNIGIPRPCPCPLSSTGIPRPCPCPLSSTGTPSPCPCPLSSTDTHSPYS